MFESNHMTSDFFIFFIFFKTTFWERFSIGHMLPSLNIFKHNNGFWLTALSLYATQWVEGVGGWSHWLISLWEHSSKAQRQQVPQFITIMRHHAVRLTRPPLRRHCCSNRSMLHVGQFFCQAGKKRPQSVRETLRSIARADAGAAGAWQWQV